MSTVLITGGAGFIGRSLTKLLLTKGYKIKILDNLSAQIHGHVPSSLDWLKNDGIEFIRGDVLDEKLLVAVIKNVDFIVHLAAETGTGQSMYEISRYNMVNVQGTAVLMNTLVNNNHNVKRVILSSSRSIYGEGAYFCDSCGERVFPLSRSFEQLNSKEWNPKCIKCNSDIISVATKENDNICPASIYASTKYAQEDLVKISCESIGVDYALLRFQNVYGEGQSLNNPYTGILSIFSTKARMNADLTLFEDGLESRDFVHVQDVSEAMFRSLTQEKTIASAINIGSGFGTSVQDIAKHLIFNLSSQSKIVITGEFRVGDIRHNSADISNLRSLLGFTPKISIEEGMKRFSEWVLMQPLPEDKLDKANSELRSRKLMG